MTVSLQPTSIAFRLTIAVLAVEFAFAVLVVFLAFGYERHAHFRAFDVMLHGRADSVLGAIQDADDSGSNIVLDQADLHVPPDDVYEAWESNGRVLGKSSNWDGLTQVPEIQPGVPFRPHDDMSRITVHGKDYALLKIGGSRIVDPLMNGGVVHPVVIVYGAPTEHLWHAIHGAVEFYAGSSLLLLLVTGPLIVWLLHRGLLPLRQLAALASDVSVDSWHFSPPESAYSTPELAPLTHAIENVLQRLERAFNQQRAFVSDAAHELKTAVAVVKSSLQLLVMKPRSTKEYESGLERCVEDCARLEVLVANMLNLARVESAAPEQFQPSGSDFLACIRKTIAHLQTIAELRDVRVDFTIDDKVEETRVTCTDDDASLLVSNIVLNALQHSPSQTTVSVRLFPSVQGTESTRMLTLEIKDQGSGIPPEALPFVFDRFYRGDPSRARSTGGTGLGLAIAKAIAQKAGGSIEIASQADPKLPFQGTTVTLSLPLAQ